MFLIPEDCRRIASLLMAILLLPLAACPDPEGDDDDSSAETPAQETPTQFDDDQDDDGYPVDNDCDDTDPTVYPGAEEIPYDGIDQDCDGVDLTDVDDDGHDWEEVEGGDDCNDDDPTVYPGAEEVEDGVDNDCDGEIDEGGGDDNDGFTIDEGDCDDEDPAVYPEATEVPYDGIDQDCDDFDLTDVDDDGFDSVDVEGGADCGDNDPTIYPGAEEIPYDGIDQDCDGQDLTDVDGDGHDSTIVEDGTDCNDYDASINPDAEEIPYDGVDQDCDGEDSTDVDGDGYDSTEVEGGTDCDDTDPDINPGAEEIPYDGIDQDCDGEDLTDVDDDGHDSTEVEGGDDCNDNDASINPGAEDVPYDGIDQDCNGEDLTDVDEDGYDSTDTEDGTDCMDTDPSVNPGADEVCDGKDNDCDGEVDEEAIDAERFYADADGDGYGDPESPSEQCEISQGLVEDDTDCDDRDPAINPAAEEVCDGKDNDCDGEVDEDVLIAYYPDGDEDGFGAVVDPVMACEAEPGLVSEGGDCDDENPLVNPDALEVCDPDNVDENCNGVADDDDEGVDSSTTTPYYPDADKDSYGDGTTDPLMACDNPSSQYLDFVSDSRDCDDGANAAYPGAPETCNDRDDDCDGDIDNDAGPVWYQDSDGDVYGNQNEALRACEAPEGYVSNSMDCNDEANAVHPGALEICNGIDDNCDGVLDDGVLFEYYRDQDEDGYGDEADVKSGCEAPSGYVDAGGDCDDSRDDVNPDGTEVCDESNVDEDCDGAADDNDDEVDTSTMFPWWNDSDQDTYGDETADAERFCDDPSTPSSYWSPNNEDCDDTEASISPVGVEVLNLLDDNCNGLIDEGLIKPDCDWILKADAAQQTGIHTIDPDGDFTGVEPFEVYCEMDIAEGGWTLVSKMTNQDEKHWIGDKDTWVGTGFFGDSLALTYGSDAKSQAWGTVEGEELLFTDDLHIAIGDYVRTVSGCIAGVTLSDYFTTALASFPNMASRNYYKRCEVDHTYVPNWATEPNYQNNGPESPNLSLNASTGPHLLIAFTDYNDTAGVISFYREYYTEADLGLGANELIDDDNGFDTDDYAQDIGGSSNCYWDDAACRTDYPETVLMFVR